MPGIEFIISSAVIDRASVSLNNVLNDISYAKKLPNSASRNVDGHMFNNPNPAL